MILTPEWKVKYYLPAVHMISGGVVCVGERGQRGSEILLLMNFVAEVK